MSIASSVNTLHNALFGWTKKIDWLGPLALRLYLAPVFWVAGMNKASGFKNTVAYFGNDDWGLGLPLPGLMAFLATAAELLGGAFLLLGVATRWVTVPLIVTMIVAITSVHWDNGWQAVHDGKSPFASEYTLGIEAADAAAGGERLARAKEILKDNGNYDWLTEHGNFIVSNNGVEWAATYLVMLLALFFTGAGRVSLDHLLVRGTRE
ncbi:MAG: DoxX family protein [Gammaproteobacteria bacterium]|nr:DoxX family protein [Gammaproteobacteria bacterium]MDH3768729.1 DoxX family protein [Gammaproteobacteria bacterium]